MTVEDRYVALWSQDTVYVDIEQACQILHDAYEEAAKHNGWKTQAKSRVSWDAVPEENRATMRAAVTVLLDWIADGAA